MVKRACAIADTKQLGLDDLDLSTHLRKAAAVEPPPVSLEDWALSTVERRHIEMVLQHVQGNKSEAARVLGIARTTLDRKLASYGMD